MSLQDIKKKLEQVELKDNVRLSDGEVVRNGKKFVESHLKLIEMTKGKSKDVKRRIGLPFYKRLEKYLKRIS